jgi:adenylate cyclase
VSTKRGGSVIREPRLPSERLEIAFAAEERNGLKLAFKLRLLALVLVALFLTVVNPFPQVLYYYALLVGFIVTGALSLIPRRDRSGPPDWTRWLVPLLDLALVTFAVVYPNPLGHNDFSELPLVLRSDALAYPIILIALSALTNSPHQVHWTGTAAAIMWTIASFWVASLPGVHWGTMGSDPHAVMVHALLQQVFLLLIVSSLLAAAVHRSRALTLRQVKAERERTQLARYFSTNLVEQLADADRSLSEVREQTVAVLFADIVGFTSLGEALSPVDLIALLREFHQRMQAEVFAHGGTLDKYLGDGLMASFGTPTTGPRDAANALTAAKAMTVALAAWNRQREERNQAIIRVGIGLHWGPVVLGDIGGDHRLEFATIGDTVNVASRLEHVTRDLNADIVASADLIEAVRASVPDEEAVPLLLGFSAPIQCAIRGRTTPMEVFARPRSAGTARDA